MLSEFIHTLLSFDGLGALHSPGRAPALPLAVRSPYTSAWIPTAGNGSLNDHDAIFWNGDRLGWEGLISVDNITYEFLGTGMRSLPDVSLHTFRKATPLSIAYDSQYSNFSFAAGPVRLTARFFSPVLPKDLCRTSIPLSYAEVFFTSTDNATHSVQLYGDVNGAWISTGAVPLQWSYHEQDGQSRDPVHTWQVKEAISYPFGEMNDRPQWGELSYATSRGQAQRLTFSSGYSNSVRLAWAQHRMLNNLVDPNPRSAGDREPVFAFAHDFSSASSGSVLYTVGVIQSQVVRYLNDKGVKPLAPWWTSCHKDSLSMVEAHFHDFAAAQALGAQWEAQLRDDVASYYAADAATVQSSPDWAILPSPPGVPDVWMAGTDQSGQHYLFSSETGYGYLTADGKSGLAVPEVSEAVSYYAIVALSTRQAMAACTLAVSPKHPDSPLLFLKEISSDGNINTVDVLYPMLPFFLYANADLLRMVMDPLYEVQEGGFYPNGYSNHDLGTHFPNATGHVDGNDEYMPVEESGNMILMTYAYYRFTGDKEYMVRHYGILKQWADFLVDFSLTPGAQLSTDDFAGRLHNQTNLALKGIVALDAMAAIASICAPEDASRFAVIAASYSTAWADFGLDPSGSHTLLAYQHRSSWGLLYNLYPARLLGLTAIPPAVYQTQSDFYPSVSQLYGVPLDSRHHYTKSDWQMWTAAACEPATRRLFVNALAFWLNTTSADRAFPDLYETVGTGGFPESPDPLRFVARPVVGGHFSLLALLRGRAMGEHNGTAGSPAPTMGRMGLEERTEAQPAWSIQPGQPLASG